MIGFMTVGLLTDLIGRGVYLYTVFFLFNLFNITLVFIALIILIVNKSLADDIN